MTTLLSEAQQRQLMTAMMSGGLVVSSPSGAKPPKASNPAVPSLATSGDQQQQQQTGKSTTGGGNGNASSETNKKKPKRCMTAYNFFFQDQRQTILMEMESQAALAAAKENAEALALARARARQEYDDEDNEDNQDAIVVDLEDSECSTDSIGHSKHTKNKKEKKSRHHRKRRRSESQQHRSDDDEVIEIEPIQPKKVTFRELGTEIGRRWKALQEQGEASQKLTRYRELADADAARYQTEMDEYHRQRVSAMCRGGNLGHRYNEARETVGAQQALQAQEALAVMKAAMETQQVKVQTDTCTRAHPQVQPQATSKAHPQVQPQATSKAEPQAQPQGQVMPSAFPAMMPMMMMAPNPLNPSQMLPCMMMMAAPAGMAMPMPMPMPMNTSGGMVMPQASATAGTPNGTAIGTTQQAQHQAPAADSSETPSPPEEQNKDKAQPMPLMQGGPPPLPPQVLFQQPQRKGFFPSIGPSLEILEDFDELPTVEDPILPDIPIAPPTVTTDSCAQKLQQHPQRDFTQEPPLKRPKNDLLDMTFDDAALLAMSKDNNAFNQFLQSVVANTAGDNTKNVPTKTVTVHKHHGHHNHHHQDRHHRYGKKKKTKKRSHRASTTSVDTNSLMKDIAKAFGEDWDPTPVKVPQNISFKTKLLEHSEKASALAAYAASESSRQHHPPKKFDPTANATLYQNFDEMMDSLETYNYESDVSGFHDLFESADRKDREQPFFPAVNLTRQDEPIFDSAVTAGAGGTTIENGDAQPFFPCGDAKASVEGGFLNNNVTTDIATLNKMALFHGRSNTNCSLDSADAAAGAKKPKPASSEVVDLTADNVIGNLQELLKRQQEILGMKI